MRELEEAGDGTSSQDVESVASSGGEREDVLSVVRAAANQRAGLITLTNHR